MDKAAISKLNINELIDLSNKFDQKGMIREADVCDKLAYHFDKSGMARMIPEDLAKLKEETQDLKVNIPEKKDKEANYTQLTELIGDGQNNRITMAAEELTRIPNFPAQQKGPKPSGIWYACGNEWISWLTYEMPQWIGDYVYSFKVDESRMLMIENEWEFEAFEREYAVSDASFGRAFYIDWAKVAMKYSGIEICPYQHSFRMSSDWYYGWDVASGCVWEGSAVLEATLVAKRTRKIDRSDQEESYGRDIPNEDDEANWDWYGLGEGAADSGSSKDPEEIAAEVDERIGDEVQQLKDDLDPTPDVQARPGSHPEGRTDEMASQMVNQISSDKEPWARPWADRGVSLNTMTEKPYHGRGQNLLDAVRPSGAKTAKRIKSLDNFRGDAALYELSEPLDGHTHVVVSANEVPMSGPETYIFGADESGEIQDWTELSGSTPGIMCHNSALKNAGYQIS